MAMLSGLPDPAPVDTPFQRFVAPARGHPEIWRLILGVLLIAIVYVAWLAGTFLTLGYLFGSRAVPMWFEDAASGRNPWAVLLLFSTFLGMALGAGLAARLMHRRPATTLLGSRRRILRDFLGAVCVVFLVYAIGLAVWLQVYTPEPSLPPAVWLSFLPLAVLGLLVQTGAEELVFRGYLQQQLAARFASSLIWAVLPSLAFGLLHFDPVNAGSNALIVVAATTVFGLIAADLTARSGSLGAAWGFHFANNFIAILIIATKGTLPGLALYLTPYNVSDAAALRTLLTADLAMMIVAWGLCRWLLRRRRR